MQYIYKIMLLIFLSLSLYSNEQNLEKVSLQLQWKHQFEFAGFYIAIEKGFYKNYGLDVSLIEFDADTDIVGSVLNSKAEYGLGYSSIIADYLNGKPIVFIANFFKKSPLVLVTQENISTLSQLKHKKIEGIANNIDSITLHIMLSKFGINSDNIETVSPTFSIANFRDKKVNAMSAFTTNELFLLKDADVRFNVFDPVSYGAKYYDANLFTSKKEIIEHPQRVENFKNASIEGWKYALEHPEEAIELILNKYNTQNKSREALLFEARQIVQIMLADIHEVGSIDLTRVEIIANDFIHAGFIENVEKPSLKKFLFSSYQVDNKLTKEDLEYLENKKSLEICVDPDRMPFSGIAQNRHIGLDADFMELFEKKIGIPIQVYETKSWDQSIGYAKAKKCDLLTMAVATESQKKYLNFTQAYFSYLNVLITQNDKSLITNMEHLEDKKIAIIKGYSEIETFLNKYPKMQIIEVSNIEEGLEKVKSKDVYGFIDNAFSIDYYFQEEEYEELKIGGYFSEKSDLRIGIRNDDERLYSIMQKLVRGISFEEQRYIRNKYLSLNAKPTSNYKKYYQIVLILIVILLIVIYRHYVIEGLNKNLKKRVREEVASSKEKDEMIFHQSKLVAMGEMIENIAHQWRQPLSQVNSCVLVIDDTLDNKGIKDKLIEEKLLEIESLTKYMSRTIEDFKNFFDQAKEEEVFIIEDIIDKSLSVLGGRIEKNKIQILRGMATEHVYKGHPNELQQALIVIINNGIDVLIEKKIIPGKINIGIHKSQDILRLTISDNAGGISQEFQEKIFEPYYTTKHKSQGTGLGLYISKVIIEDRLGGKLRVKNNFNGASFIIELPNNDPMKKAK